MTSSANPYSTAAAVQVGLSGPDTPALLFDTAEEQLGPVGILVSNAAGWPADTFAATTADRLGPGRSRRSPRRHGPGGGPGWAGDQPSLGSQAQLRAS